MILRQVHVGRMQYAPTLPTEKAIPNDWFRVIALRHSLSLSAAPDECLRTTECLFAAPGDSQSIVRGVFGSGAQKHTLHRMHFARGV